MLISKFKRRPSYADWLLSITEVFDHFSFNSMSEIVNRKV